MKKEYLDHYGIDCLPHLREVASFADKIKEIVIFGTLCKPMLDDREELKKYFPQC